MLSAWDDAVNGRKRTNTVRILWADPIPGRQAADALVPEARHLGIHWIILRTEMMAQRSDQFFFVGPLTSRSAPMRCSRPRTG